MNSIWNKLNRWVRLAAVSALVVGTMGSGGGSCCGQNIPVPPPPLDITWCDFSAVTCLQQSRNPDMSSPDFLQPNGCLTVNCTTSLATGAGNCSITDPNFKPQGTGPNDFSTCDPSTCTPDVVVKQNSGLGFAKCFDHTKGVTATDACNQLCLGSDSTLDPIYVPPQANLRSRCTGTVDLSNIGPGGTTTHPAYNATSTGASQPDYVSQGCVDPGQIFGDPAGTNRVAVAGSGHFSSPDVPAQDVPIIGGLFNVNARNITCNSQQNFCPAFVNQWEILFADFAPEVQGSAHPTNGLSLRLDQAFRTPSGTFFPAGGGLPASFSFGIPPGVVFDSIGTVDGNLSGLSATSDQETSATINLATGQVVVDFDLTESVDGHTVNVTGTATSANVVDVAPVVSVPATLSVDATTTCSVSVTLAPTASSLLNLPVTFQYAVDGASAGSGPTKTVSLAIGAHSAAIVGVDSLGGRGDAVEAITVNDKTAPVFGTVPPSQTVKTCSNAPSTITVTVPTAVDFCTQAPATVTGTVTRLNGATVSIPITNGSLTIGAGTATIHWVATNANGVTTPVDQTLTVVAPPTFFGSRGVAIADRSIVNGSVYVGAGGSATVGNDSSINGNLISASPVQLRDRTTITLIDTNAGLTPGNSDTIGTVLTVAPVLPPFPTVAQSFTGTQVVTVPVGGSRTLAPGQYGAVTVFSGGRLTLSTGTYAFTSLDLEPQATLVTPSSSAETARVFVRDSVIYRGRTATAAGALAPLFLGYAGAGPITIEAVYTGTIIAPNATLTLQSLNGAGVYTGEFFARQLNLSPADTTNSSPFTCP
jgi:hypothetical protein